MNTQAEIDVRKKEKKIDRNHWMCRIQKYSLDIDAPSFYMGYCPFFWMTWVAVMMTPIAFLWKTVFVHIVKYIDKVGNKYHDKKMEKIEKINNTPLRPYDHEIAKIGNYLIRFGYSSEIVSKQLIWDLLPWDRSSSRIFAWIKENPDWFETTYPTVLKSVELKEQKAAEIKQKKEISVKSRNKVIRKISNAISPIACLILKFVFPILIVSLILAVIYAIANVIAKLNILAILEVFIIICGLFILSVSAYLIFDFIRIWLMCRKSSSENKENRFGKICINCFETIKTGFQFIRETVKMTYKQECPLLLWGEETRPIQKRTHEK